MKKGIHPENYRLVVFKDMSNDEMFLCKSTAETKDTIEYEGQEYPFLEGFCFLYYKYYFCL